MSLPPGFLDELRNRTSLARVVGRKVMWDARKSNQGKGDMWAPCPFHQEKSASFHVDDKQGFYYCFGCHAKGDAIGFVRETENVGFMEAVEILAREAGMQMPARDPKAQARADRGRDLAEVMEQAVQYYRLALRTGAAGAARDYLAGRGLDEAAQARFEIGFAPDQWRGLYQALSAKGISADLLIDSGLCARPQDGGTPYDRFRGRIIFPIRDARGRCIALGGRALDPAAPAKYLNSPETALFDKGRSLYNHGPAREAAGKGAPLIVTEGYMDVIALVRAGFEAAVAPLGTAITEAQLRLMWRIHPEPIIALDGDAAGLRAAMRVIDVALPLLESGQSLRFCLLPEGSDPDDLIRAGGPGAMQALLDQAQPMVRLLWQRETEGKIFDSPERKAALDKALRAAIRKIADPSIRGHYGDEINRLRQNLFRGGAGKPLNTQGFTPFRKRGAPAPATPSAINSPLARISDAGIEERLREAVILATILATPQAAAGFLGALEETAMSTPEHDAIRVAILRVIDLPPAGLGDAVAQIVGADVLEKLYGLRHVQIAPAVRNRGDLEIATMCLAEEFAKLEAERTALREINEAMQDIALEDTVDEGLTWRLQQASEARARTLRAQTEDRAEYELAPNGARLNRSERNALAALLDSIADGRSRKLP